MVFVILAAPQKVKQKYLGLSLSLKVTDTSSEITNVIAKASALGLYKYNLIRGCPS
uniref:Uncharacterized protein n=1 Tax=Rhizophora mucronata TaxID=61149 RepID=A0A2P2JWK3_RHIMU